MICKMLRCSGWEGLILEFVLIVVVLVFLATAFLAKSARPVRVAEAVMSACALGSILWAVVLPAIHFLRLMDIRFYHTQPTPAEPDFLRPVAYFGTFAIVALVAVMAKAVIAIRRIMTDYDQ